ncbi:rhomboid protease GlpG [Salmonella enterica subsp. enterica serovar Choleraesuis]|nr:rhomboid protease GlpG [Salmonella enterica subsp. enterica serovar Choleraesuis]
MLMITSLANPRMAQAFVDYMATQGVVLTLQHHQTTDIWLADESQLPLVERELEAFLANPNDSRYLSASWKTGQLNSGLRYQRYPFRKAIAERAGPLTLAGLAVNILIFILMQSLGDQPVMIWLAWPWAGELRFEAWRYVTHALMHFSVLHLLFNLIWWWYLGGAVEKRLGTGKLFTIFLVAALVGGFIQNAFSGPWFGGLSGVVYALIGYVWLMGERAPDSGLYLQRGVFIFALLWLVVGWFDNQFISIANASHVSGLLIGLGMAAVDLFNARKRA